MNQPSGDPVWRPARQRSVTELFQARLEADPDSAYLDVCGTAFTAREVADRAGRLATALRELGVQPGDRVATLVENSPEMLVAWYATIWAGAISVPVNTAYKGDYLRHQLNDSGARVLVVAADLEARVHEVSADLPRLEHVITLGEAVAVPGRDDAPLGRRVDGCRQRGDARPAVRPRHVRLHRRHHRLVQGLHADAQLPRRAHRADRLLLVPHRGRRGLDGAADVPLQRAS